MLEIKNISKTYKTGDFVQKALDNISINFRENEFASILGPSGSGKTTLLNIIGGLDHYDEGDLIINEVSTKKYKSKNWDSYRNHRVGFVFQNYNLITHQSILKNVEIALTLSGVSKKTRKKKAIEMLTRVGLKDHMHKRPNELSGGQMQRVSIARALVNNPDIILADEPTGALDSKTSVQIMELLKEIAEDKLVIMVTHNPELANKYSNRIVNLSDGKIVGDSNPYDGKENTSETEETKKVKNKKTSMKLSTSLGLSLNNLMTKKGRTMLTAFAGSIGIIGIALILSLSTGVQNYIDDAERTTFASYPITISKEDYDMSGLLEGGFNTKDSKCDNEKLCTYDDVSTQLSMTGTTIENNLKDFKKALENNFENINDEVTNIEYNYEIPIEIYDNDARKVNPFEYSTEFSYSKVEELINNKDILDTRYDIIKGNMPTSYDEVVLIVDENNQMSSTMMYMLGLDSSENLKKHMETLKKDKNAKLESKNYTYDDILNKEFKVIPSSKYYQKENGIYINKSYDKEYIKSLFNDAITIKIVGIIKPSKDSNAYSDKIGYTHDLTTRLLEVNNNSEVVLAQEQNKDINVLTNQNFDNVLTTYKQNIKDFGASDIEEPTSISIYPKSYESKDKITKIIDKYNEKATKENKIEYTDFVSIITSNINSIINVITYVLIAFVAISLVVSSIMIAIITYISVLERTKEIGILRAVGASKKDIRRLFTAETIIEGFLAGALGVLVTNLLCIPINKVIATLTKVEVKAQLDIKYAIILVTISVILTVIAGLIPSRVASKKDPVESLRSE